MDKHLGKNLNEVEAVCAMLSERSRILQAARDKNSSLDFYAIRVPKLRIVSKTGFTFSHLPPNDLLNTWDYVFKKSNHYEPMVLALYEGLADKFGYTDHVRNVVFDWSSRIENWGHCDLLGNLIAMYAKRDWHYVKPTVERWSSSNSIWLRRLSLISMVDYVGKHSAFLPFEEVLPIIDPHLTSREVYIANAVGWVLREYLKPNKEPLVREYVTTHWNILDGRAKAKFTKSMRRKIENE